MVGIKLVSVVGVEMGGSIFDVREMGEQQKSYWLSYLAIFSMSMFLLFFVVINSSVFCSTPLILITSDLMKLHVSYFLRYLASFRQVFHLTIFPLRFSLFLKLFLCYLCIFEEWCPILIVEVVIVCLVCK